MTTIHKLLLLVASAAITAQAAPSDYTVDVSRQDGSLNCTVSKANGGTYACTIQVGAEGDLAITMTPTPDGKSFYGVDSLSIGAVKYVMAVTAILPET